VGIALLEDIMSEYAARFIDRLEAAVLSDRKMAYAVSCMWSEAPPIDDRFRALVARASDRA
jgi:hypothetical protein